jgi:hypothetical protein
MKIPKLFKILCLLLLCLSLIVAGSYLYFFIPILGGEIRYKWQGPSPTFSRTLDKNHDGELSRSEWQSLYMESNILSYTTRQFHRMDCNYNGRVTWGEYFDSRFKSKACAEEDGMEIYSRNMDVERSESGIFPMLVSSVELDDIQNPVSSSYQVVLDRYSKYFPAGVLEQEAPAGSSDQVTLVCTDPGIIETHLAFDRFAEGEYPSLTCSLENNLSDFSISVILVEITAQYVNDVRVTHHVKAFYVPTGHRETVTILFPRGVAPLGVSLLLVRGMAVE